MKTVVTYLVVRRKGIVEKIIPCSEDYRYDEIALRIEDVSSEEATVLIQQGYYYIDKNNEHKGFCMQCEAKHLIFGEKTDVIYVGFESQEIEVI